MNPGPTLSVQMHHHRAEHCIVVSDTAKVQSVDKNILLTENHCTYIPLGVVHAQENPGKIPLELIEVQSGPLWAKTISSASRTATVSWADRQPMPPSLKAAPLCVRPSTLKGTKPVGSGTLL